MTRNASFIRKIVYISLMGILLIPLSYLSQPSGVDVRKHPGGKLDQMRRKYDLSQSSLGEVDPTSETMKLATLGMRGVATTVLWGQANEHKKKENWDEFATVLRQISKLQPHFIQVWVFQAWNQSYNVSVEFDDYNYRYHWVKKGIDYLLEGTRYNQRNVKLQNELGWVFGHKIGRSDEKRQFRRLFKADDDFHKSLPIDYNDPKVNVRDFQGDIDNWLVGREFYLRAIRIAEATDSKQLGQTPVLFYSNPPMQRMNYAETILEEGYFGPRANLAWQQSGVEWARYGDRVIPTSISGLQIQLDSLEETEARVQEITDELEALLSKLDSDVRAVIRDEKYEALTDDERAAYDTPADERTNEQAGIANQVERQLEVGYDEILQRAPDDVKKQGARLSVQLTDMQRRANFISSYRGIVNYEYWATRCAAEQTTTLVNARRDMHDASQLLEKAVFEKYTDPVTGEEVLGAKELYENAWDGWAKIFQQFPVMLDNPETEDLLEHIDDYRQTLAHAGEEFPQDFKLQIVLDIFDTIGQRRGDATEMAEAWAKRMNEAESQPPKEEASPDPRTAVPSPPMPADEANPRDATPRPPTPAG